MITERTLKKWRKEALENLDSSSIHELKELSQKILEMTQELLDQHLLRK